MNKQKIAISVWLAVAVQHSMASSSFDEVKPRLQKILQCDPAEFPKTKKQTADLASFEKALKQVGAKMKIIGNGGVEDKFTYRLPSSVSVFGQEVMFIDSYQAPFVSITFPIAAADLVKTIEATNGIKFKSGQTKNMYEQTPSYKSKVEGEKYPMEHDITVIANSKNRSSYVCNYRSTDPNIGG